MSTDLVVPSARELWDGMPLAETVQLEEQAEGALEDLRQYNAERFYSEYSKNGKAVLHQQEIADELGISQPRVSQLMSRAGIEPASNRGRPRIITPNNSSSPVVDDEEEVTGEIVQVDLTTGEVLPRHSGKVVVAGVQFPGGGISEKSDLTEYSTADLKRVANDLIRRATPKEAMALHQLLVTLADKAKERTGNGY